MELNSWQRESSPHLFVSFNELDSDEKEKYLEIVRAIKTFFLREKIDLLIYKNKQLKYINGSFLTKYKRLNI